MKDSRNTSHYSWNSFAALCVVINCCCLVVSLYSYSSSRKDSTIKNPDDTGLHVSAIVADFTVSTAGLQPLNPPDMLAVHRFVNNCPEFEVVDYGDPAPPYVSLFFKWTQLSIPRLLLDDDSECFYVYDSPRVTYLRADLYERLLAAIPSVRHDPNELPKKQPPQKRGTRPPSVAICCDETERILRFLQIPSEVTMELPPDKHQPRFSRQDGHRRHGMLLGG